MKPANVLLDTNGEPRVTDFGLAKRVESDSNLTRSGAVMGTPSYMPPEQAGGKADDVGPHSDVYSLGAILYYLLTGRPPFQSAHAMDILLQVLEVEPVSLQSLNPVVPKDLDTVCLKCLQKEPNRRYESAAELSAELDRYINGEPIQARPVGSFERLVKYARRNRLSSALASILVIGVSALLFPICTLDPLVLAAYAAAIDRAGTWFWLAGVMVLIFGVRELTSLFLLFAGRSMAARTFGKSERSYETRKSPEEILWQAILLLAIGAPAFCLLMFIVQIIRLLTGKTL